MTNLVNSGGLMSLIIVSESGDQARQIDEILMADSGSDAPFSSLIYANLVVFSALLFSFSGLEPTAAIAYVFCAFLTLTATALAARLLRGRVTRRQARWSAISAYIINELALVSILWFDWQAAFRADGFVAIVTVASLSFISVPLFARFMMPFMLVKFTVLMLCGLYALTNPSADMSSYILIAALLIAYLFMVSVGYWIINRRREEVSLRLEVSRLHAEAERAREQSRQDFELRQRLLSYVGHDMRQPISAAGFILHEMSSRLKGRETRKLMTDAQACIQSTGRMIEDVVQIAHYNNPEIKLEEEVIALSGLFEQIGREFKQMAVDANVSLTVVNCSLHIRTDPDLLTRILRNLVKNALLHSKADKILIGVRRRDEGIEIWIVDNGKGMPAAIGDRLSERPYGESPKIKQESRTGLGLGLDISRQIAVACGFALDMRSAPGRGTCGRIKVPRSRILIQDQNPGSHN